MNRREQARRATALQEWIAGSIVMALAIIALGWIALRGDDIRAHRQGMTTEEMLEHERREIADQISAYRAENPNTSRCGWPCIERIPTTGETWGE